MDVKFEIERGRELKMEIGYFDTVLEIKEKIQKYFKVPVSRQTLIFNGEILLDERDVADCMIFDQSRIRLAISPEPGKPHVKLENNPSPPPQSDQINLLIKLPSKTTQYSDLEVGVKDSIRQLKEKILAMDVRFSNVPINRMVLRLNGMELSHDEKTLPDYYIMDHSIIDVTIKASPTSSSSNSATGINSGPSNAAKKVIRIMVLPKSGTSKMAVDMNASDNVGELRKVLEKQNFPVPREGYFFIYKQAVMDDDKSFWWHQVSHGDTIEIFNGSVSGGL